MARKQINIRVDQEFTLSLEGNPTTGYTWEAQFDENILTLKKKQFDPYSPTTIGGGGTEIFTFVPVKRGETHITMQYKRLWEEEAIEEKTFWIVITD
jgi:inhibitor of cysteine peptidase